MHLVLEKVIMSLVLGLWRNNRIVLNQWFICVLVKFGVTGFPWLDICVLCSESGFVRWSLLRSLSCGWRCLPGTTACLRLGILWKPWICLHLGLNSPWSKVLCSFLSLIPHPWERSMILWLFGVDICWLLIQSPGLGCFVCFVWAWRRLKVGLEWGHQVPCLDRLF